MTSTTQRVLPGESAPTETGPGILGLSHHGITVRDVPAAQQFWTSVMGFATLFEGDDFCMIFESSSKLAIGVTNQQGPAAGSFDERQTGLDHVALALADLACCAGSSGSPSSTSHTPPSQPPTRAIT